ncbi:hypothetical protein I5R11_18995 [Serratia marcescens]|nr:hypothetical protein [Serratia marcescens]
MDNKLSELSNNARKAVNSFYNWSQLASCTSERVSCLTVEQLKETSELLSALLAENERVASDLVARNGEIEGLRKRAAELEAEITNIVDSHAETVAELRAKLATPVRLPNKNDDEFWFDGVFQVAKFDRAVERAIRAAGFTVEGDE